MCSLAKKLIFGLSHTCSLISVNHIKHVYTERLSHGPAPSRPGTLRSYGR